MSSVDSSVGVNNAGCASGPHKPSGTAAERASMQEYRVSSATQPRGEHVIDRLIHQISLDAHAQEILVQVNTISAILDPASKTNGGS